MIQSVEAIVMGNSILVGNSVTNLKLRTQYNVNLLAITREDIKIKPRIAQTRHNKGDVLLLQGEAENPKKAGGPLIDYPWQHGNYKLENPGV